MGPQMEMALGRRELLELGLFVITLAPHEARATGSWAGTRVELEQRIVLPGSYRWRVRRYREFEERRRIRGEFNRFGSAEE
jgi:hypothetical protein